MGNDVERMLTDYYHWILCFHDQFVEVIARGLCFEESQDRDACGAAPAVLPDGLR